MLAYLVLLRVEIARFTPALLRNAGLVSVALILASRRRGVTSYAALRSPDLPPAATFRIWRQQWSDLLYSVDYPRFFIERSFF